MEHLNPVDQARQLAAEVVKRLGQLNLHRRELERKLHVANGFFTSLEEKKYPIIYFNAPITQK